MVKTIPIYDQDNKIVAAIEVFTDERFQKQIYQENIELKDILRIDPLTQVANRNYFDFEMTKRLEAAKLFSNTFGILMIDIDRFKNVNDTYGHLVGDIVLKAIGQHTASRIRQDIDKIYRYGGEEFIIFFSDVKIKEIFKKIEEIREEISQKIIEDNTNKNQVRVTVSFGLVEYPENGLTINKLIENADKALYYSKTSGRNKTTNFDIIPIDKPKGF